MESSSSEHSLYQKFLTYEYSDLEEMVSKAKTLQEREFWARLCDFYFYIHQERVMRDHPY